MVKLFMVWDYALAVMRVICMNLVASTAERYGFLSALKLKRCQGSDSSSWYDCGAEVIVYLL